MKKALILVTLSLFIISCSFTSNKEYIPAFYQMRAFADMKGNVMSVENESWKAAIVDTDTIFRNEFIDKTYSQYTEQGLLDSTMTQKQYTPSSLLIYSNKHYYYKNKKTESISYMFSQDKFTSDTTVSRFITKQISKEKEEVFIKTRSTRKEIRLDTLAQIIDYDYDKKTVKVQNLIEKFGRSQVTSYMDNHLLRKLISEYPDRTTVLDLYYDNDNNLSMTREECPEYTVQIDFKYLKYDEQGNWTERLLIYDNSKIYFESRQIEYRE